MVRFFNFTLLMSTITTARYTDKQYYIRALLSIHDDSNLTIREITQYKILGFVNSSRSAYICELKVN